MHTLLLLAVLSQSTTLTAAPHEMEGSPQWVQRHLMSFEWNVGLGGPVVRVEERTVRIQDTDFADSFVLVPSAHDLAVSAKVSFDKGNGFLTASMIMAGVGAAIALGGSLSNILVPTRPGSTGFPVVPYVVMGSGLVTMLASLVVMMVGMEPLKEAQGKFLGAIAAYNRGLLDPRSPPVLVTP